MTNQSNSKAYIAAFTQSITVGFSFLATKIALKNAPTLDLLAHRFFVAAIAVLVVSILGYGGRRLSLKDFIKIAPYGLVYPIAVFFFQTIGVSYVSSSESGIINALAPIITFIIAAIMLHEHITIKQALFMILSVCGVIFINYMNGVSKNNYNIFGISMIIISVISLSLYSVLIKRLSSKYSAFNIATVLNFVGFIFFNGLSLAKHANTGTISSFFVPFTNLNYLIPVLFLGICSSLMTSMLNAYALKRLPAVNIGLLGNLSTIISILAGVLILNEAFYWYHGVGIVIVLIGTIGFNFSKNKKDNHTFN